MAYIGVIMALKEEGILENMLDITIAELAKKHIALADIVIEPDLGTHSSYDYSGLDPIIEKGYKAAKQKMDEIKKLIKGGIDRDVPTFQVQVSSASLGTKTLIRMKNPNRITELVIIAAGSLACSAISPTHREPSGIIPKNERL
jgi:hypothetical protein